MSRWTDMSIRTRLTAAAVACLLAGAVVVGGDGAPSATPAPPEPDLAQQRRICFPAPATRPVRTFRGRGAVLWTDAPDAAGRALVGQLERTARFLAAVLPVRSAASAAASSRPAGAAPPASQPARRPVAVALYARQADYLALWRRVGTHYGGRFGAIATAGYSYRVFGATTYGSAEAFRRRMPVLCHEFTHVWLYQNHGLPNDGNWLTEGLANAVQLHFFPTSGNRDDFVRWLETGRMLPLKRLMDLPRIQTKDYWQAATLAEVLLGRYGRRLPAVIAAHNAGRSAYRIVTEVLGTDFPTLGRHWASHVRARTGLRL